MGTAHTLNTKSIKLGILFLYFFFITKQDTFTM